VPARSLVWDGRDDRGERVASGTYFVRVATPSETRTLKLTLVK
jgi:flagellar hook assembly protein FlgD